MVLVCFSVLVPRLCLNVLVRWLGWDRDWAYGSEPDHGRLVKASSPKAGSRRRRRRRPRALMLPLEEGAGRVRFVKFRKR